MGIYAAKVFSLGFCLGVLGVLAVSASSFRFPPFEFRFDSITAFPKIGNRLYEIGNTFGFFFRVVRVFRG